MKVLLVFLCLLILFGFVSYGVVWQGPWVDRLLSELLSRQFHATIHCKQVRIHRWTHVDFQSFVMQFPNQGASVQSGAGDFLLNLPVFRWRKGISINVRLERVRIDEKTWRRLPLLSSWVPLPRSSSVRMDRVRLGMIRRGNTTRFCLKQFSSENIQVIGGMRIRGRQATKAHAVFFLSGSLLERLPSEIKERLIQRQHGWFELRFFYQPHEFVLSGQTGPFLKARWQF